MKKPKQSTTVPYPTSSKPKKKGSSILLVLVLCAAILLVVANVLNRGVTDTKTNIANNLYYEAKNAAESFAEYGCADVVRRFESKTSFPRYELRDDPIVVPSSHANFYNNSNVDLSTTTVAGGQIEDGYWMYLDPEDPRWEFDPMKGKKILVRDIQIFAKGTAKSNSMNQKATSAYVQQTLQVRDSPLFSNAIFYNLDLELNPGPNMDVYGTVHTNRDLWVGVNTGSYLKFHEPISATGHIYHGDKKYSSSNPNRSGLAGEVYMMDSDSFQPMNIGSGGTNPDNWLDANHDDWREKSSQRWDGNVQDKSHNVPHYNAAGIEEHVADIASTSANELENHAYAIIEPILTHNHPDVKSESVRNQKMMAKAGLIFRVEVDDTTDSGFRIRAYKWKRVNAKIPVNAQNPFDGNLWTNSNGDPRLLEVIIPDHIISRGLTSNEYLIGVASPDISRVDNSNYNDGDIPQVEKYEQTSNTNVTRGLYDHRQDLEMSLVTLDISILRQVIDDQVNAPGVNLVHEYWRDDADYTRGPKFNPKRDWNGVVYIEFPTVDDSGGRTDHIVKADPNPQGYHYSPSSFTTVDPGTGDYRKDGYTYYHKSHNNYSDWNDPSKRDQFKYVGNKKTVHLGLQLINGEYIPSPTYCDNKGLTIVTNAPMYVIGHYNADGVEHSQDAQTIEKSHYQNWNGNYYDEPPAALMADTITLLSEDWRSGQLNRRDSRRSDCRVSPYRDVRNTDLEFSAALVTGISPAYPKGSKKYPDGCGSGGAINLPRFLEDWSPRYLSKKRVTIRSSLVALFESEVHTLPYFDNFNHFYEPPVRDWGFNENFMNQVFPPGTPNVRSFRRTEFRDISEEEYTTGTVF